MIMNPLSFFLTMPLQVTMVYVYLHPCVLDSIWSLLQAALVRPLSGEQPASPRLPWAGSSRLRRPR